MAHGGKREGAGRPKGSQSREFHLLLKTHAPQAIEKLTELALAYEPNIPALKLLVERTVPPLRAETAPVTFELKGETSSEYARSIVQAASSGELSPTVAAELLHAVASCMKIIEVGELAERMDKLEQALK